MADRADDYFARTGAKLIRLIRKHFHIEGTGEKLKLHATIRPASVESFFTEYVASIRPANLGPRKIVPRPDPGILRALYIGSPSATSFLNNLVRHSLYADQILITDPFQSIVMLDHPRSVRDEPAIWMDVVVNKAIALCAIADWITSDIVRLMPNPYYYHREVLFKSAVEWENRGIKVAPEYTDDVEEEFLVELLLSEEESHWDALLDSLEALGRPMTDPERAHIKLTAREQEAQFPIRFRLTREMMDKIDPRKGLPSKMIAQGGGTPFHLAPELAKLTGSFMLFEKRRSYDLLVRNLGRPDSDRFQEIALAFQELEFPFLHNVPIGVALEAHGKGYMAGFRNYLRDTWSLVKTDGLDEYSVEASRAFRDRLIDEYANLQQEWDGLRRDFKLGAISRGIWTGASVVVAGTLNWAVGSAGFVSGLASAVKEYGEFASKFDVARSKPLSVFVELARRTGVRN